MVTFKYQLIKLEIPCVLACFGLPCFISAVPFITHSFALVDHYCGLRQYKNGNCSNPDQIEQYIWFIPGSVVAGISVIIVIVAVLSLAYQLYQKSLKTPEREELIAKRDQRKYSKALRETLPFVTYPATILVLLIIDSLTPFTSNSPASFVFNCISDVLSGCMGGISAGIFFIHFLVRFQCLSKRPPIKLDDDFETTNTRTSSEGHGPTFYTAEEHLEQNN